jgi:hypothetical protein
LGSSINLVANPTVPDDTQFSGVFVAWHLQIALACCGLAVEFQLWQESMTAELDQFHMELAGGYR